MYLLFYQVIIPISHIKHITNNEIKKYQKNVIIDRSYVIDNLPDDMRDNRVVINVIVDVEDVEER